MPFSDLPILAHLNTKMRWHAARQTVLAQNIANADTPGFVARDLEAPDFSRTLARAGENGSMPGLSTARTQDGHLSGTVIASTDTLGSRRAETFEVTPRGNSVVLEEEVNKVTANQLDYQAATTLYSKSLGLIRMALGRQR